MSPLPGIDQSPDPRSNSGVHAIIEAPLTLGAIAKVLAVAIPLLGAGGTASVALYRVGEAEKKIQTLEEKREKDQEKAAELPLVKAEVAGLRAELASFRSEMKESMRELQRGVRSARDGR